MKEKINTKYLIIDFLRLFRRKEFYLGIVAAAIVMIATAGGENVSLDSTLAVMITTVPQMGFLLSYIFCALAYGTLYCDDLENKYIRYEAIRGNLKKYVCSKTIVIFVSSLCIITMGFFIFVCYYSFLPPVDETGLSLVMDSFRLLKNGHYMTWFLLYGFQWGIWGGCLSVIAAFLSLYISNRLLVLAVPVLIDQTIREIGLETLPIWINPTALFDGSHGFLYGNDGIMLLWAFTFGCGTTAIFGTASYYKLKKRM